MPNPHEAETIMDTTERQELYVTKMKKKAPGAGIVFADAFLRGMRDIGYKSPAWSLAELIDNSVQSAAATIEIVFGFKPDNKTKAKPDHIAIVDDGNGMIPEMISYAVRWGGTDRENDRSGFGRYGYGLPTSAVSLACRYTVYSKIAGRDWYAVTVDTQDLAQAADSVKKIEELLTPVKKDIPQWVVKGASAINFKKLTSGTVIVLEELDRLRKLTGWITRSALSNKLHQHFGLIYRHWMPERRIFVDGEPTQVVDPLFLMEHGRFFDENAVRAQRVETRNITISTEDGNSGTIRIRASLLPPTFQRIDPLRTDSNNTNKRWDIMRAYNALLICRQGRQIDEVQPRWVKLQTYDANLKIEIDFDASLDEFFGITTNKQQITISDEMWEKLQHGGRGGGALTQLIADIRKALKDLREKDEALRNEAISPEGRKASERAMEDSEKFKARKSRPSDKKINEGRKNLEEEAAQVATSTGQKTEDALRHLENETRKNRWSIIFESIQEGPFFIPRRMGEQKRVVLNTSHPFYHKVYEPHSAARSALEVLLFTLADAELDSEGDTEIFYKAARQTWSERLRHALDVLITDSDISDKANAVAEALHQPES